jgi:hypothetical protein
MRIWGKRQVWNGEMKGKEEEEEEEEEEEKGAISDLSLVFLLMMMGVLSGHCQRASISI